MFRSSLKWWHFCWWCMMYWSQGHKPVDRYTSHQITQCYSIFSFLRLFTTMKGWKDPRFSPARTFAVWALWTALELFKEVEISWIELNLGFPVFNILKWSHSDVMAEKNALSFLTAVLPDCHSRWTWERVQAYVRLQGGDFWTSPSRDDSHWFPWSKGFR